MDKFLQNSGSDLSGQDSQAASTSISELIEQAGGFARRQYPIVLFFAAVAVALGFVYLFTAQKQYTANALLLMDYSKARVLQQNQQAFGEIPLDTAQVETQIELLKSENIGLSVVKDLKLTEDPEFVGSQNGMFDIVFGFISKPFFTHALNPDAPVSENALSRRALGRFLGRRDIKRVGRTYVLSLSYTSPSPAKAAAVANAMGEAYILDQLESKYQATRRASVWLQDRVSELRVQAMAADRAVLEFKEQKNIVSMGGGGSDRLLTEQQMVDLNAQLASSRMAVAEAKARLDRIKEVMKRDVLDSAGLLADSTTYNAGPDTAGADTLRSSILGSLREKYLDLDRRRAVYSERYGTTHLAVVNIVTQMAQLKRSMSDELSRLAQSYNSDFEIAKAREASLEQSLSQSISGAQLSNRDKLGLKELESRAKVYQMIHDSFLQRYMEMSQQQSFPITESRLITSASPPGGPSSPQSNKTLLIASALGLLLGFAAAAFRESIDRVFRTTRQVETLLHTNCLAVLPIVKHSPAVGHKRRSAAKSSSTRTAAALRTIDPTIDTMLRHVVVQPLSAFSEGLRAVKVAVDISRAIKECKVVGFTSALPSEGKSTVASNLAQLIAQGGSKVILLDCDLRNPTLSRKKVDKPAVGLIEVISGKIDLHNAIHTDEETGLDFLPAIIESRLAHSSEILASEALRHLIDGLRKSYDYIIVDLPPLAPVVDVRATTRIIDSYVFVIEWGQSRLNMVQHQLAAAPEIADRLLGAILNKANTKILDRYENYYGRSYYKKYYGRYGYTQ